MKKPEFRAGDTVCHRPSEETWILARVRGNDVSPAGWPETIAQADHCDLVQACSDAEHAAMLERCAELPISDWRSGKRRGAKR